MKNSKTVLIDKNPGRSSQTYGIARILNTDLDLIHEPSIGVVGNKGDSQCYLGVEEKVKTKVNDEEEREPVKFEAFEASDKEKAKVKTSKEAEDVSKIMDKWRK